LFTSGRTKSLIASAETARDSDQIAAGMTLGEGHIISRFEQELKPDGTQKIRRFQPYLNFTRVYLRHHLEIAAISEG
jgi:hypothetical protein